MRRIIIAGTRTYHNYEQLCKTMETFAPFSETEIVSGHAAGADTLGEQFAKEHGIPIRLFPADWSLGRKAGPLRNATMAEYAREADEGILVAFWDGESRGTLSMIREAKRCGLKTHIVMIGGD